MKLLAILRPMYNSIEIATGSTIITFLFLREPSFTKTHCKSEESAKRPGMPLLVVAYLL